MKRKDLLTILDKIKSGTSNNRDEVTSNFLFTGKEISSYDDQIAIQHPLKTDFSLFVNANNLYKIVTKLKTEQINLSKKNEKLNIKNKTSNLNLSIIQDTELTNKMNSIEQSMKNKKWKALPTNFINNILLCYPLASKQESDQTLTYVFIENQDCIASDNSRIAFTMMDESMPNMFIKASKVPYLIKINPVKYAIGKSWIHFKNTDNCIFSMRKIEGVYPDFLQFKEFDGTKIKLSKKILEGVDLSLIVADVLDPLIIVKIANNICYIVTESELGKVQYKSKIEYSGKEISFTINPEFLKEMMSHSSSIIISKERAKLKTDTDFALVTSLYA